MKTDQTSSMFVSASAVAELLAVRLQDMQDPQADTCDAISDSQERLLPVDAVVAWINRCNE